ncbi:CheY-like chemotaxis protein [Variibacter gotjawalensis]|nr:response regulator [Variibacter gotjawalensis]NIK48883.1 CheY-like chemotaxis protein [Variibacter gotjawalensis]
MAGSVLIVEDDFLINLTLQDLLEEIGFSTAIAYNADEAISILEVRNDFDLVITDIDMPGSMDGLKLAAFVRDRWPPLKIMIVSGKHRPSRDVLPEGSAFLAKPFSLDSLSKAVHRLE